MITSVKLHSKAATRNDAKDDLLTAVEQLRIFFGGEWEPVDDPPITIFDGNDGLYHSSWSIQRKTRTPVRTP